MTVNGTTEFQGAETLSNKDWHLSVDSPGQIALNYRGLVTIGSLTVDGQPYDGVYVDSTTHPGLVSGNGIVKINQAGLILILR